MDSENITPIQFLSMYQNNPKKETANERKATEIAKNIVGNDHYSYFDDFKRCALQAMQWKDEQFSIERKQLIEKANQAVTQSFENGAIFKKQQLIDKACEWLFKNTRFTTNDIRDFKNAME